ncbi:MAG: hypothetical protein ACE5JX_06465 [Acidobacteriota bacterium]
MKWLSRFILLLLAELAIPGQPWAASVESAEFADTRPVVRTLSYSGAEFRNAFNATADRTRLILVFSPT